MLQNFEKERQYDAMESRDHSENGASLKSHTIRENFLNFS